MKKILILLVLALLCACGSREENNEEENNETPSVYIEAANDIEVFSYLEESMRDRLYKANADKDVDTYFMECLGNELISYELTDINGNTFDLADYRDSKLIIEIAGSWCSHCKDQALKYTDELLEKYPEIVFIQYFNEGGIRDIKAFYAEISHPIPDNMIIVPEDRDFSSRLLSSCNPRFYPGFLFYNEGFLSWVRVSDLTVEEMDLAYDLAFVNSVTKNDLLDEKGASVFSHKRTKEDVKNDLSKENYALLEELDNDSRTIENTLSFLGRDFGFRDQYEDDSTFVSEVDLLDYEDKDLAIIYCGGKDDEDIKLINDFYHANSDISVVVLNLSDEDNEEMAADLVPPLVSIMNQVPKLLNDVVFDSYPSVLYIKKGIITGAYSNVADLETMNRSVDIFLRDTSIALLSNN